MNQPTQLASASALVQLLTEHPTLPAAAWQVDGDRLVGTLHGETATDYEQLYAYDRVVGGRIHGRWDFESLGRSLRSVSLRAVWRDVQVEVRLLVPAAVDDEVLAAGRSAEQRHLLDPPVMNPCGAAGVAAAGIGVAA
jgi:hypothetical protein